MYDVDNIRILHEGLWVTGINASGKSKLVLPWCGYSCFCWRVWTGIAAGWCKWGPCRPGTAPGDECMYHPSVQGEPKTLLSLLPQVLKQPCSQSEGIRNSVQLNPILNFSGASMPNFPWYWDTSVLHNVSSFSFCLYFTYCLVWCII